MPPLKNKEIQKQRKPKAPPLLDYKDFTWIGTIANFHGVRGELKIFPLTDTPDYYLDVEQWFIETQGELKPFEVEQLRLHKNMWIVKLSAIEDRAEAEIFLKRRVFLEDTSLRPLAENEFFLHELIGCRVEDLAGSSLGEVQSVLETGANDVYVVLGEQGEFMIPAHPEIVKSVDLPQKVIRIDPMPGLLE